MKKFVLPLIFIIISISGFTQEIGVRGGEVLGNNWAVDAVLGMGDYNRTHIDVSFGDAVGVEILWDFFYRPLGGEAFDWYIGVGPSALINDPFLFGISGEIGLEYHFRGFPMAIGADWRPTFFIVEDTDFDTGGFGINARFVFGGQN